MKIKIFEFNPVRENTYLLYDDTKECVIIDPGCFSKEEQDELLSFISYNDLKVVQLLNTHLHFDHVFGINFVKNIFDLELAANKNDEFLLETLSVQMQMFGFESLEDIPLIDRYLNEGDIIRFGNQELLVLSVPGHSPGSIAFYNKKEKMVVVGDALFKSSIGRTDLPKGDHRQLLNSIQNKLFTLPTDTLVYPGHGPSTTIGDEIKNNPFFN